ncbi:MAG: DUF2752 domain-containing protein [Planctomycetaceae bacterium]|nr:DUF2752 domain-containing protein [Planctomycetaceae bacterium]
MTSRQEFERTLGWPTRRALVLAALGLVGVLGVARQLEPDPRGFGTHTQLGLAPCAFALVTGHPCPTCGMTTSFAWFARGRFDRSWRANPAGSVLALTCVALIPWLLAGAARGRPPGFRSLDRPLIGLVVATVALSLVSWTLRLILGRA